MRFRSGAIPEERMRVGHFQVEVKAGDFAANIAKFTEGLRRADADRVEILCFPELFLTGSGDTEERARAAAIAADSQQMMKALDASAQFQVTAVVGFGEMRDGKFRNSAAVLHKGHLAGIYSKCSAYEPWETQGRDFPVFERNGVKFGVIICSDGGYIEPARILAAKGARIIFAPHQNYIGVRGLLEHYRTVRSDHTARAVENSVYFVRGNNYHAGPDPAFTRYVGAAYGDSYILDPRGEIVIRSRQFAEDFIFADIDPAMAHNNSYKIGRSLWSHREFAKLLDEAAS
jgi:predicted amidohydrolase